VTRETAAAVAAGVVAAGGGTYLYFAHRNGWWPFKKKEAPPEAPNPPGQPTVQTNVTGPNTAEADVSWGAVPGAAYYKVFVDGREVVGNVSGTTAKLTGLVPGRTYSISVAACN